MPIDPNIALQTQAPNPLGMLSQLNAVQTQRQNLATGAIKQQADQQDLQSGQIKLQQQQQGARDQTDTRAAYAAATDPQTGQVDKLKLLSTLGKLNPAVAAQTAQNLTLQDTAAKEAKAKADAAQLALAQTHINLKDKLLQGATPATWANTRAIALQNGVQPQEIPEQWPGDEWVAQAHAQTMSQKDTLDAHLKSREADQKDQSMAETEDNNAVERDQAAANAAETARHDKRDESLRAATVAVEQQKAATAAGDPKAAGQLLANSDATLSELKARGSSPQFIVQAINEAKRINPKYSPQSDEAQFSVAKSPANVAFFGSAKSLTDKGGTLDQLAQVAKDIPSHQIPVFNTVADAEKAATGSGPIAKYASLMLGVSDDYAKVMGGGQGSDSSRSQALHLVPANASPEARAAAIEGIRGAVGSQINSRIGKNKILGRMYGGDEATEAPARPSGVPSNAVWNADGNGGKGSWRLP